jgi:hypothetical protein
MSLASGAMIDKIADEKKPCLAGFFPGRDKRIT